MEGFDFEKEQREMSKVPDVKNKKLRGYKPLVFSYVTTAEPIKR